MQEAEEQLGYTSNTPVYHNNKFHDVVAIDNDEVLLLMQKEMYAQEGIHCDTCTDTAELMEILRRKEYNLLLTDLNMPGINGFELLELLRSSNVGNSQTIPGGRGNRFGQLRCGGTFGKRLCRMPVQAVLHIVTDGGFRQVCHKSDTGRETGLFRLIVLWQ